MKLGEVNPLFGLPVVYNRWVPKGTFILFDDLVVIGTWWRRPSVSSIITSQRRRRKR